MWVDLMYLNFFYYPKLPWYEKYTYIYVPKNLFYIDEITFFFGFFLIFFNLIVKFSMFEVLWITHIFNKKNKSNSLKFFLGDVEHRFEKLITKKSKERSINVQFFCWNSFLKLKCLINLQNY